MKTKQASKPVVAAIAALALLALGAVGCSSGPSGPDPTVTPSLVSVAGARPSSTAKLAIVTPKNGEVFNSSTVPLRVSLTGGKLVVATSTNLRPDEGHLHVLLDDQLISMTSGLRENIPDVKPGTHLMRVEYVANDHAPFNPRVIAQVTFRVSG